MGNDDVAESPDEKIRRRLYRNHQVAAAHRGGGGAADLALEIPAPTNGARERKPRAPRLSHRQSSPRFFSRRKLKRVVEATALHQPRLAHSEFRLEKLMPLTHSSFGSVEVGTIWPPGHMQNE